MHSPEGIQIFRLNMVINIQLSTIVALDMTPLGWLGRKTSTQTIVGIEQNEIIMKDANIFLKSVWQG